MGFQYTLHVKSGTTAASIFRRAVQGAEEDSDVFFSAMAATAAGEKQIGVGFVNLKELYATGTDLSNTSVPLKGTDERRVGSVDVSLAVVEALHRAVSSESLRLCISTLQVPADVKQDPQASELMIEVDMLGLAPSEKLRTKVTTTGRYHANSQ